MVLLAGAGPATRRDAARFHAEAVRATGKASPVIAYVGAAANDNLIFEKLISRLVFGAKATVVPVRLKRRALKTSTARSLLADADLVFFTGGDVEVGMQLLESRELVDYLRGLHGSGTVMEGISAGSIMLGRRWVRFPDDEEAHAHTFPCLGIAGGSFDTHGEADGWSELRTLARVAPEEDVVFGIPSNGAALWDGRTLRALGLPLTRVQCGPAAAFLPDLLPLT